MDDDRRRRFQGIERPRTARPEDPVRSDPTPGTGDRFVAVARPGEVAPRPDPAVPGALLPPPAPLPPEATGAPADRFRPPVRPALEVDAGDAERQPFIRCVACETDNSRYVTRCTTCGAALDSEAQQAFNQRLWAERRAEAAALAEASAVREAAMDEARDAAARGRRQAAEQLAWEIGQRERDRLARDGLGDLAPRGWGRGDAGGPGGWGGTPGDLRGGLPPVGADHPDDDPDVPPALRLLRRLPGPAWQVGVGVALLAVPALLFVAWPPGGVVLGALVLLAFTPARWRSRRDW